MNALASCLSDFARDVHNERAASFSFAMSQDNGATWETSCKRFLSIEGAARAMAAYAEIAAENNISRPVKIVKL